MPEALLPFLLLAAGVQETPAPAPASVPAAAPEQSAGIDWTKLPDLPYRQPPQMTPAMNAYVAGQARVHRCRQRRTVDGRPAMRVEVAVLVHPEDGVRTSIPRAIGCSAVEQYAAGLVSSFARNNLTQRTATAEQWYRATVTVISAK